MFYQKIFNILKQEITLKQILIIALGCAISTFGIYNIHQQYPISEGGIIGLVLLIYHWFHIKASIANPILDSICYILSYKVLGLSFIIKSIISSAFCAIFFSIWELFPRIIHLNNMLLISIVGGLFIGIGVGLVVSQKGSCGGDDAIALMANKVFNLRLNQAYLISDIIVLLLSLSYIPLSQIIYSLITVIISGSVIDLINNIINK